MIESELVKKAMIGVGSTYISLIPQSRLQMKGDT